MKKYICLLCLVACIMACSSQPKPSESADSASAFDPPSAIEDPDVGVDLTTYLKSFAGVYVNGNGSSATITIRGINSISGGSEPLMLLDGQQFMSYSDLYGAINTTQIKRIEVLKNPNEIGIYGVRGANGVIKITTKKQ